MLSILSRPLLALGLSCLAASALAETPTAGIASGHVVDSTGKPLAGAVIHLELRAVSGPPYQGKTDATGAYAIKLAAFPLIYKAHAWMPLKYRDKVYCVRVAPETEADEANFVGRDGAIRNFRWRVSGSVDPSGLSPETDNAFYGGTLRLMPSFEDGGYDSTITLTLTPDGPLIDGSAGKTIVRKVDLSKSPFVYDIPIGAYKVTATRTLKSGATGPVKLGPNSSTTASEAFLEFKPHDTILKCGSAADDNGIDRAFLTVTGP